MKGIGVGSLLLRARLGLARVGSVTLAAAALIVLSAGMLVWLLVALPRVEREHELLRERAARAASLSSTGGAAANGAAADTGATTAAPVLDNLDSFYAALGRRSGAEQQVGTLFALAAKSGLVLSQGEYKSAWDRNARVHTYQVNLPVKGSYAAIWQFALAALRAIPFAALDDISFRRDGIGDPTVEARLRMTLYLSDADADGGAGGVGTGAGGGAP
jgi:hypothetical protein